MSRGFVKENDQEEIPIVPPRAYLPAGATNYMTQAGMNELLAERELLVDEKNSLDSSDDNEKRIMVNHINAKLQLLNNRIAEAKIVNLNEQPQNEIRFGAVITVRTEGTNKVQTFQIVGVDEASISRGKISFLSPFAKIVIDKRVGDKVIIRQANENSIYEILDITYR